MPAIKSILAASRIGDQAALVLVGEEPLEPAGADIVFRARAVDGGQAAVAIQVDFYFSFSPPGGAIGGVDVYADADAEKTAPAADGGQQLDIGADSGGRLPAPVGVKIQQVFVRVGDGDEVD